MKKYRVPNLLELKLIPLSSTVIKAKINILSSFHSLHREIYQYLDEVDYNCDRTINNVKQQKMPEADFQTEIDYTIGNDTVIGDVPKWVFQRIGCVEVIQRYWITMMLNVTIYFFLLRK